MERANDDFATDRFDFVVVGAGSAGCVAAARLAGEYRRRVLLIEAGERCDAEQRAARPAEYLRLFGSALDWDHPTEPQTHLAGRRLRWPRGRGLGGSSLINAMIWVPPRVEDFAPWHACGGPAWAPRRLAVEIEAFGLPSWVETPRWISTAGNRFLEAAGRAIARGAASGRAAAYLRMNRNGRRVTAADSCLSAAGRIADLPWNLVTGEPPAPGLPHIRRGVSVRRIVFEKNRAVGVELHDGRSISAGEGVVLAAGALGSPELLLRSGIGPADALQRLGIPVVADRLQVGANLQDHLAMPVVFGVPDRDRFAAQPSVRDLARWQTLGTGPLASNLAEVGGWFDLAEGQGLHREAIQLHVTPTHYLRHPAADAPAAMTIAVTAARPASRGRLWLERDGPALALRIDPAYGSAPRDFERMVAGIGLARRLADERPLAAWITGELAPGRRRTGEDALRRAVARYAQTLYHPVGTCCMGAADAAVVTPELSVRGAERLWVVDASVFPEIPPVNPNAMVMLVAHRAAGLITERE